jgi:hypothetical protein
LGLLRYGIDHSLVLVAEIGAHELRGKVQITLPCSIDDVTTFSINDVHRIPVLLESPGAVVILPGKINNLLTGERL